MYSWIEDQSHLLIHLQSVISFVVLDIHHLTFLMYSFATLTDFPGFCRCGLCCNHCWWDRWCCLYFSNIFSLNCCEASMLCCNSNCGFAFLGDCELFCLECRCCSCNGGMSPHFMHGSSGEFMEFCSLSFIFLSNLSLFSVSSVSFFMLSFCFLASLLSSSTFFYLTLLRCCRWMVQPWRRRTQSHGHCHQDDPPLHPPLKSVAKHKLQANVHIAIKYRYLCKSDYVCILAVIFPPQQMCFICLYGKFLYFN